MGYETEDIISFTQDMGRWETAAPYLVLFRLTSDFREAH